MPANKAIAGFMQCKGYSLKGFQDKRVAHCGAICSPIMPVAMDAGPSIRNPRKAYSPNAEAHPHCTLASLI